MSSSQDLSFFFDGWTAYRGTVSQAVALLSPEQLAFRLSPDLRSLGELVRHMALGPLDWFTRMDAPGSAELAAKVSAWHEDPYGNRYVNEEALEIDGDAAELVRWLDASTRMIAWTLDTWSAGDLEKTYRHVWRGDPYAITRQWTLFRILAHDLHHGGEISLMLGAQGIENFELGGLGGHVVALKKIEGNEGTA